MKRSAGLLLFRRSGGAFEVFLVHPGGPFWARKDDGAWSIPKGEYLEPEDPLQAAIREFEEEVGSAPQGEFLSLGQVRQAGGKLVSAWAVEGDLDPSQIQSNTFEMEWPPRSGKIATFPEIDHAAWFLLPVARAKILTSQRPFLDRLEQNFRAD